MTIAFEMHGDVCVFAHPSGYDRAVDALDDLLERRNFGTMSEARYRRGLEDLVSRHPWFVDGHAHLGIQAAAERVGQRIGTLLDI